MFFHMAQAMQVKCKPKVTHQGAARMWHCDVYSNCLIMASTGPRAKSHTYDCLVYSYCFELTESWVAVFCTLFPNMATYEHKNFTRYYGDIRLWKDASFVISLLIVRCCFVGENNFWNLIAFDKIIRESMTAPFLCTRYVVTLNIRTTFWRKTVPFWKNNIQHSLSLMDTTHCNKYCTRAEDAGCAIVNLAFIGKSESSVKH